MLDLRSNPGALPVCRHISGARVVDHTADEAQFFARLSQELMQEGAEEAPTLQRVAERVVDVVGPCRWASISVRRRRNRLETVAVSDERAERADQLQYALGEGPCLEAALHEDFYFSGDLAQEGRWPKWAPRVHSEGICSVLSIRLSTMTEALGALNLYAGEGDTWTSDDVDVAVVYAVHAANAMSSARLASGLQLAVEGRHNIGVAQGILMMRYDLTREQSFKVLRRLSSTRNVKLRDLAAQVVEARGLPADALTSEGHAAEPAAAPAAGPASEDDASDAASPVSEDCH